MPNSAQAQIKFRIVCATRLSRAQFATHTALGRSLALFPYPFVELRLFPDNSKGLPILYNQALREAAADPAMLVFVHDDVYLQDYFWPNHVYEALRSFDIIGIAGNKRRVTGQPAWRFIDAALTRDDRSNLSGIVAHGTTWPPQYVSYYGPPYQQVQLLDGLFLASSSETLLSNGMLFDERFDFHFYDLDFCRQAELRNLRLGTCSVSAMHASDGRFGTPSWKAAFEEYLRKWQT
jgi:GT2 family glycosyltransferase